MKKNYTDYDLEDLLTDDYFLQWVFLPSKEINCFWDKFQKDYPEKKKVISRAIHILESSRSNLPDVTDLELDMLYEKIYQDYEVNNKKRSRKKILLTFFSYAASIVIISLSFLTVYLVQNSDKTLALDSSESEAFPLEEPETRSVKLYIDNKALAFQGDVDISLNPKDGKIEVANKGETQKELQLDTEIKTNKIIVPYGKRSTLLLSDSTKIYLNSGTTVTFPSQFASNHREIEVEGEIYIEVKKDLQRPFIIKTQSLDVCVYGTKFNVSAYKSDITKSIALVEGSIGIRSKEMQKEIILSPNELYTTNSETYSVEEVDTYHYISWVDGILYFTEESLVNITNKLSRHYGVNISCDPTLVGAMCTGKLVLFEDLDNVLSTLADIFPIKYDIEEDNIRINTKKK